MNKIFGNLFFCIKTKKTYFIFLCIATIVAVIVGVYAGFNFNDGVFSIDLSNIAYIKFLQGECGLFSLVWGITFSLLIFFTLILIFSSKKFLLPLAVVFYVYLVYSQVVVLTSLIVIYGFLNSLILFMVLLVYVVCVIMLFILSMMHMACFANDFLYFKNCFNARNFVLWLLLAIVLICVIFSLLLMILKSFVILLVY